MSCLDPEDWWELDTVQQLLGNMLEEPDADHSQAVAAALDAYGGALLDAHVHGLIRALEKFVGGKIKRYSLSRTVALHVWLFHLGGGVRAKLLPAPAASSGDAAAASRNQEKAATKASAAFFSRRRRLREQVRAGSPAAAAELAAMRAGSFDFKLLRGDGVGKKRARSSPLENVRLRIDATGELYLGVSQDPAAERRLRPRVQYKFLCTDTSELRIGCVLPPLAQDEVLLPLPGPCIPCPERVQPFAR